MGGGGDFVGLALADAGHKEGNVPLYINWELLHLGDKLGFGSDCDGTIDL